MEEQATNINTNFVVYGYYRKNWTPYYIGKGRPSRPYQKGGRPCPIPPKDRIVIIYKNIDEQTAFDWEIKLIKRYGRKGIDPDGILLNKSLGGQGTSGVTLSDERRKQISEAAKERLKVKENNPMFGKTHTPEVRKILSDKAKSVKGREHPRTKLHNWTHNIHGDFESLSILELIQLFPEENLKYSTLYDVVKGRCICTKGWKLLSNKNLDESEKFKSTKKLCTWKHPEHGVHENISAPDLAKLFPELNRQSLNRLSNGKILEYKGWTVLNSNCNNHSFEPKRSNWYHKEHGLFKDYTVKQLCEQFKEMNLIASKLSLVRSGKVSQHKGWKIQ